MNPKPRFAALGVLASVAVACSSHSPNSASGLVPHTPATHMPSAVGPCPVQGDGGLMLADPCTQWSDCATGKGCMCGAAFGTGLNPYAPNECVAAKCTTDADCGKGGFCSPSIPGVFAVSGVYGFFCHTPNDTCDDYTDCSAPAVCVWGGSAWGCAAVNGAG